MTNASSRLNAPYFNYLCGESYGGSAKTLTCTLDSPGCEKDREKKGFHWLVFVMSKLILIGDVCS